MPSRRPNPSLGTPLAPSPPAALGLWRLDAATRRATWTPGLFAAFGQDPALGVPRFAAWASLVSSDDRASVTAAFREVEDGGSARAVAFRARRADGTTRELVATIDRETDASGATTAIVGCVHDGRALARADDELWRSEDRLRRTVEGIDAIIVYRELNDEPLYFSDQLERILGYRPEAFRTFDDWNAIVHPDDLPACRATWDPEPESWAIEYRVRRADGRFIWIRDRGRRTPPRDGRPGGVFSIITDVDELHALDVKARQLDRLEATGWLAGGLAHHFNNILAAIEGYVELARAETTRDDVRADLDAALEGAQRAARLVHQLRAFGRRERVDPEQLDVTAVVDAFAPTLATLLHGSIELDVAHAVRPLIVDADPTLLERMLANLAVNAADAMPRGGRLAIATSAVERATVSLPDGLDLPAGRYARIEVADTGSGMDADTTARVFEPFFTTKGPAAGLGMSLPAVYGVVRQMGGTVEVTSEPGAGTMFTIDLPIVAPG